MTDQYPNAPGFKKTETSEQAARSMDDQAGTLRAAVLALISQNKLGLTADECAERLGRSVLAIRPRLSELRNRGQIMDSGARGTNESSRSAIVWIATGVEDSNSPF